MSKIAACRVCLSSDKRLCVITNSALQEVWEKLTSCKFNINDGRPELVCYLCRTHLWKSYKLQQKALKTEKLLSDVFNSVEFQKSENYISLISSQVNYDNNFVTAQQYCYEFPERLTENVQEIKSEKKEVYVNIKEEDELSDSNLKESLDLGNVVSGTDSEDDNVPLRSISVKKEKSDFNKRKEEKPRKIILKKISKGNKLDAIEIELSKEEQIEDMLKRRKSKNYLYSPYKCDLCYKGFVNTMAYENHMERHSECSGEHECDICHMRYKSARFLRTHAYKAHEKRYKCNKCSFTSQTFNQAKEHERWHEGCTYECELCGMTFRKPTTFLSHVRVRHPTENVCDVCGENFVGRMGLMLHQKKSHRRGEENVENTDEPASERFCKECNIQFLTVDAWKRHVLISLKHMAKKNGSQCKICHKTVGRRNLPAHMREHGKDMRKHEMAGSGDNKMASFDCNECGSKFSNAVKLSSHVKRMHLGLKYNKNIVCEVCGKKFTSKALLVYHQRSHTGERPYECPECTKRFRAADQLKLHIRTHTGERPYGCSHCGKRFKQKPSLNRHYRVHTGDKPYECQYCSRAFSQSNSLKGHIKAVHLKIPSSYKKKRQKIENMQNEENKDLLEVAV